MTVGRYSNTILGAIIAVVGLGIAAAYFLPNTDSARLELIGLVVLVVNVLLGTRQAEQNGHRLTAVETVSNVNAMRLDETPGAPAATPAQDPTSPAGP